MAQVYRSKPSFSSKKPETTMVNTYISCGVDQLYGLSQDSNDIIRAVIKNMNNGLNIPYLTFSDPDEYGNGLRFVKYLKKHKLGLVIGTRARMNPNSGNNIRVWIWSVPPLSHLKKQVNWKEEDQDKDYNNWI